MKRKIEKLVQIFTKIEKTSNVEDFSNEIAEFYPTPADEELINSLNIAVTEGDSSRLNNWLYSLPSNFSGLIPWIGKVKTNTGEKFVWMIGVIDSKYQSMTRKLIDAAWEEVSKFDFIKNDFKRPPFLVYINPIVSSDWQKSKDKYSDFVGKTPKFGRGNMFVEANALSHTYPLTPAKSESLNLSSDIAIFQVNYSGDYEIEDIDQKIPLNSTYLANKAKSLFKKIKENCSKDVADFYSNEVMPNIKLISKLHAELHNYGHFVGPWGYTKQEKHLEEYEAIEEFRACLVPCAIGENLDISPTLNKALSLHVFLSRYLEYGFNSYKRNDGEASSLREMEVGNLFYWVAQNNNLITFVQNGKIDIDIKKLPFVLKTELVQLHNKEKVEKLNGIEGLLNIANEYRDNIYKVKTPISYYNNLN
jgi:hypothetical protein